MESCFVIFFLMICGGIGNVVSYTVDYILRVKSLVMARILLSCYWLCYFFLGVEVVTYVSLSFSSQELRLHV